MKNLFHKEVKDILAGNFREQPLREEMGFKLEIYVLIMRC